MIVFQSLDFLSLSNSSAGADPGGRLGRLPHVKPTKVTLFTMILNKLEK